MKAVKKMELQTGISDIMKMEKTGDTPRVHHIHTREEDEEKRTFHLDAMDCRNPVGVVNIDLQEACEHAPVSNEQTKIEDVLLLQRITDYERIAVRCR